MRQDGNQALGWANHPYHISLKDKKKMQIPRPATSYLLKQGKNI